MEAKLYTALISIVLVLLALLLIRKGWKGRTRRDQSYGVLAEVPARYENEEPLAVYPGTYVATTSEGDYLNRITADSLGFKADAQLFVFSDALVFSRQGSKDVWIPAQDVRAVRTSSGMSGKFVEKDGLAVISWTFNGTPVDTGFRTRYAEDKKSVLEAVTYLIETHSAAPRS